METKLLEQIVRNTAKYSKQIIVSDKKTEFNTVFNPPIELDVDYEIALVDLETYYSFPNIKNNIFEYFNGKKWQKITIQTGSYEIRSLNDFIQNQIALLGDDSTAIELSPNRSTLKTMINIKPGYKVTFMNKKSLREVLGFKKKEISAGLHESDNIANILDVNTILVHLNIISGSYVNGNPTPVIYAFFPNVSPGYKIVEKPHNLIYLPVAVKTIKNLKVTLTDQDNNPINLRGETITIKFHMRQI